MNIETKGGEPADKTDAEWHAFCRPFVYLNGSHEMPNYPAICRAVAALQSKACASVEEPEWPKLDKPARVLGTFGVGVSAGFVVRAAQRYYESTEAERKRTPEERRDDELRRRAGWDLFNGFAGVEGAALASPAPSVGEPVAPSAVQIAPGPVYALLRRSLAQLGEWQRKYGEHSPQWLPPAGDVRLAEDIDAMLNQAPIATPPAAPAVTEGASDVQRTINGESWRGMPVAGYLWTREFEVPQGGFRSLKEYASHWSTGPKHAERLYRQCDVEKLLAAPAAAVPESPAVITQTHPSTGDAS